MSIKTRMLAITAAILLIGGLITGAAAVAVANAAEANAAAIESRLD